MVYFVSELEFSSRKLRELRAVAGLSQRALATAAGVSHQLIAGLEQKGGNPTVESLSKIATVLNVDAAELMAKPEPEAKPVKRGRPKKNPNLLDATRPPWDNEIRVYGKVPCGPPEPSPEGGVQPIYLLDVGRAYGDTSELFGVIATGTSMRDAGIAEGDLIILKPNRRPDPGEIVLASIGDSYTVKKFVTRDGVPYLESCDGKRIRREADERVGFIARVVGVLRGWQTAPEPPEEPAS